MTKFYNFDEIFYYKKGEAIVSNKKIIFIGFRNESKSLGKYEILTQNILKVYLKKANSFFDSIFKSFNQSSDIRIEVSNGGSVVTYTPIADEYTKDEYREEMRKLYNSIHEAESGYKKAIEDIEKNEKLSLLKILFKEKLQSKDGFDIDIPNVSFLALSLEKNQHEIALFDKKWIHDFVKIKFFLQDAYTTIKINFRHTIEASNLDDFIRMQNEVSNQIEVYDKVYGNALILIDSVIENNNIICYEIYEIFDKLGFFESHWERRLIKKFDDLSDSLCLINKNIENIIAKFEFVTQANIAKMNGNNNLSTDLIFGSMPMLALYGGHKLGRNLFGPSKIN